MVTVARADSDAAGSIELWTLQTTVVMNPPSASTILLSRVVTLCAEEEGSSRGEGEEAEGKDSEDEPISTLGRGQSVRADSSDEEGAHKPGHKAQRCM